MAKAIFEETTKKLRILVITLLFLIIVYPFFNGNLTGSIIFDIMFSLVLVLGLYSVSYDRKHFMVGVLIAVPTLLVNFINLFTGINLDLLNQLLHATFFCYLIFAILTFVISAKKVTSGLIYGAVGSYFLMGIMFACLFAAVEVSHPGSFSLEVSSALSWFDFLYFSFTTLTTLGYGDMTPLTYHGQSLAIVESSLGVLFIAVLVARLVGMYSSQHRR